MDANLTALQDLASNSSSAPLEQPGLSWQTILSFSAILFAGMQGTLTMESADPCRMSFVKVGILLFLELLEVIVILTAEITTFLQLQASFRTRLQWLNWLPACLLAYGILELLIDVFFLLRQAYLSRVYWLPFSSIHGKPFSLSSYAVLFYVCFTTAISLVLVGWRQRWWWRSQLVPTTIAINAAREEMSLRVGVMVFCMVWALLLIAGTAISLLVFRTAYFKQQLEGAVPNLVELVPQGSRIPRILGMRANEDSDIEGRSESGSQENSIPRLLLRCSEFFTIYYNTLRAPEGNTSDSLVNLHCWDVIKHGCRILYPHRSKRSDSDVDLTSVFPNSQSKELKDQCVLLLLLQRYRELGITIAKDLVNEDSTASTVFKVTVNRRIDSGEWLREAPLHIGNAIVGDHKKIALEHGAETSTYVHFALLAAEHISLLPLLVTVMVAVKRLWDSVDQETLNALRELSDAVIIISLVEIAHNMKNLLSGTNCGISEHDKPLYERRWDRESTNSTEGRSMMRRVFGRLRREERS
ncbi:hypothetical protein BWQ96_01082 [Gracilariopsis chorda]|uniref:Uncharacterized protein n=1 Tax=Gracilariopsis chorda TaxID=448386 RepID=A0A2V3J498_9FLOR|nr:hypothetical protein BWQ96_01082 [Gracilariopsis chorda]|eukprot:PXF49133.1 hypothetical protein BWQ96_01082 [Gracilariopsis chorda]